MLFSYYNRFLIFALGIMFEARDKIVVEHEIKSPKNSLMKKSCEYLGKSLLM